MHAFTTPRQPAAIPTTHLRALMAEPGGRRRLLAELEDQLDAMASLDDQQLLLRAGALLEDRMLHDLERMSR
jgi:hypothetical protein